MSSKLTNFYNDNAYDIDDLNVFMKIEDNVFLSMTDYASQIMRNRVLGFVETYRVFPVNNIPAGAACYDIYAVLSNEEVNVMLGLDSDSTLAERKAAWDSLLPNDPIKLRALDQCENYVDFSESYTVYPFNGVPVPLTFNVISFDLYIDDQRMQIGVDFDISHNRLYFLSDRARNLDNRSKKFTAYDIAIDYNTVIRYYGDNFNLPQYEDISKNVYNEILQRLISSALKGPTPQNMTNGIMTLFGDGKIYDYFSAPDNKKDLWNDGELSPFAFVAEIPLLTAAARLSFTDIAKRWLDKVKPTYTNYYILIYDEYDADYERAIESNDIYDVHAGENRSHYDIIYDEKADAYEWSILYPQTNNPDYTLNYHTVGVIVGDPDDYMYSGTIISIPQGRMKGDVNADGIITSDDATEIQNAISTLPSIVPSTYIPGNIICWCADVNNDESILASDVMQLNRYIAGQASALDVNMADYYGNWTYVSTGSAQGYWYIDVPVTASFINDVSLVVTEADSNIISGVSIIPGGVRITATRCPIMPVRAAIINAASSGNVFSTEEIRVSKNSDWSQTIVKHTNGDPDDIYDY